jgi:transposase
MHDRLGPVLHRLSRPTAWQDLEAELWASTVTVYEVAVEGVRLDSTTCGYHSRSEEGLMQYGPCRDHRPDLAQVKVRAAAAQPWGHLLACDVHAGKRAADALSSPLIARVRQQVGRKGVLYAGDSKMAALADFARAQITLPCMRVSTVSHCHLTPLWAPLRQILAYLQLSPSIYTRLAENSS